MITVNIDISEVIEEFSLTKEQANNLVSFTVKEVTARFGYNWSQQAKTHLHASRQEYLNNLIIGEEGPFVGYVMLTGVLPGMIENGCTPFDMKRGFSESSKKKLKSKGGWYLTIPFRFATPGTLGESSVFSSFLPTEVHKIAKQRLIPDYKSLRKKDIPVEFQKVQVREKIVVKSRVFEEYKHKSSIYQGMTKGQLTGHSHYVTFRRVSDLSDPNSWIHTGITARNLADKALAQTNVEHEVDIATDKYLQSVGF